MKRSFEAGPYELPAQKHQVLTGGPQILAKSYEYVLCVVVPGSCIFGCVILVLVGLSKAGSACFCHRCGHTKLGLWHTLSEISLHFACHKSILQLVDRLFCWDFDKFDTCTGGRAAAASYLHNHIKIHRAFDSARFTGPGRFGWGICLCSINPGNDLPVFAFFKPRRWKRLPAFAAPNTCRTCKWVNHILVGPCF